MDLRICRSLGSVRIDACTAGLDSSPDHFEPSMVTVFVLFIGVEKILRRPISNLIFETHWRIVRLNLPTLFF